MYLVSLIIINFFVMIIKGKINSNNLKDKDDFRDQIIQIINLITFAFDDINSQDIVDCILDPELESKNLNFLHLLEYSGKSMGELGNKYDCEDSKLTYFIVDFNIDFLSNQRYDTKTVYFLNQSLFFVAMCATNKCINNIVEIVFFKNFSNYLQHIYNFENITFYFSQKDQEIAEKINNMANNQTKNIFNASVKKIENPKYQKIIFIILLVIVSLYLFMVIFITLYRISFYYSTKKSNLIKLKNKSKIKIESLSEKSMQKVIDENSDNSDNFSIFGNQMNFDELVDKEDKFFKYFSNFDIIFNIQCLLSKNNIYYNNMNIEIVGFFRSILMFLLVFCQIFLTTINISQRDQFNEKFYKTFLFSFIKLSGYVNICWVILDGIVFGFKLINYIKKYLLNNSSKTIPLKMIFYFYLFIIPKVLIILFIYFFLYILSKSVSEIFVNDLMFDYYLQNNITKKKCYKNPFVIFIPFYTSYYNFKSYDYESCYKYIVIYSNELYCMLLVGILLYFSIKLKKKFFDIIILLLIITNFLLFHAYYYFSYEKINEKVTFLFILGQTFSERYFHLMINYFFIGFFIGLSLFYYKDSMSKTNIRQILNYTPFGFCSDLIIKINNFMNITKTIIIFSIIVILFIISTSFSMFISFYNYDNEEDYGDENNIFLKFCNIYEKNFFAIFFGLLIFFLIVIDDDSPIIKLINSNLFVLFERINLEYFCSIEFIIDVNFTVFHYNLTLTYQNLFYSTIGFVIFANLINMAIIILLEIPMRKFTKDFLNNYLLNQNIRNLNVSIISNELNSSSVDNNSKKND